MSERSEPDAELKAIRRILAILAEMVPAGRERVLVYVCDRNGRMRSQERLSRRRRRDPSQGRQGHTDDRRAVLRREQLEHPVEGEAHDRG